MHVAAPQEYVPVRPHKGGLAVSRVLLACAPVIGLCFFVSVNTYSSPRLVYLC